LDNPERQLLIVAKLKAVINQFTMQLDETTGCSGGARGVAEVANSIATYPRKA
jgi:hypothetical protein